MLKLTHKNCLTSLLNSLKNILFYFLQLLFGGSKLQASGLQKGPFATAKQHLIACRNRAQTYPQKLPNVPSEFRLPERTLRHSKTAPHCVPKPCSNLPTKTPNVPSEFVEKVSFSTSCSCCQAASIRPPERTLRHSKTASNCVPKPSLTFFWIPRKTIFFCLLQLLFGGSKLQASGLQNGPFATAK